MAIRMSVKPRTGLATYFSFVCILSLLTACGGAPSTQSPTAIASLPIVTVSTPPTTAPTQLLTSGDTKVSNPTTTQPATIAPAQATRVQLTSVPPTVAAIQTSSQGEGIVGSTVAVEYVDVTLHDAQLFDTFTDTSGKEVTRPGFKNVLLSFGFKRLALRDKSFNDIQGANLELIDTDGDRYSCLLASGDFNVPVGYEFRRSASCQVPVTVADSLKPFRATVVIRVAGTPPGEEAKANFILGERTSSPPEVPITFERDHVASVGQVIAADFGSSNTQDSLEFTVENARWSNQPSKWIGMRVGVGEEIILIDLTITNRGKRMSPFGFGLIRPLDMVNRISTTPAAFPEGIEVPVPGETKTVTIPAGSMKRHDGPVPIFIQSPLKLNGTHYDYLVVETTPKQE